MADESSHRRRRSRPPRPVPAQQREPDPAGPDSGPRRRGSGAHAGLRNLIGADPSVLGVNGALRGRDVNRPSEAELADAEREVRIVRRHWKPPS